MACERARVTIDEAPSSPVTPKVRFSCHVTSLHSIRGWPCRCDTISQHPLPLMLLLVMFFLMSYSLISVFVVQPEEECDNAAHTL